MTLAEAPENVDVRTFRVATAPSESTARLGQPVGPPGQRSAPASFRDFIYQVWGAGIAKHLAIPYKTKLGAVPLEEASWLGGRVPLPDLEEQKAAELRAVEVALD